MDEVTGSPPQGPKILPKPEWLCRPIAFETPERLSELSAWTEHTPFAMWLVEAMKPRTLVELGSHAGVSYCAFTQAVKRTGLSTACYAIDTWQGDEHTNKSEAAYADNVFEDLKRHHDPRYSAFSRMVRSTFEEAVGGFADGSIDLLHIDGYHTYEAVRGDFETWFSKLSKRAVVLFHDINVRGGTFGAWRFWDEISPRYPAFHFLHGHGLGVLAVGPDQPDTIRWLTSLDANEVTAVREFFGGLGRGVQRLVDTERSERRATLSEAHAANMTQAEQAARTELADAYRKLHEANLLVQAEHQKAAQNAAVAQRSLAEAHRRVTDLQTESHGRALAIASLEHRVRGFETSTSWRLTAPVRLLGRSLGRFRRLLRSARHRIDLARTAPAEAIDTPSGHADWYEVISSRGRMPNRWAFFAYEGPAYEGTVILTLYIDHGDGHWHPLALPAIPGGRMEAHLIRLPDRVAAMKLKVQGSREPLSDTPKLKIREIGQGELGLRLLWRERQKAPRAFRYLMKNGLRATLVRATQTSGMAYGEQGADLYQRWIEAHDTLTVADRAAIAAHIQAMPTKPLISVVVPVYNTAETHLRAMLDSVLAQLYPNWELCLADDASPAPHVRAIIEEYARHDPRVKAVFRERNGHISAASNSAIELATGSHVALLDHDDLLSEHALYIAAVAINENPGADIFYSDEDKISDAGLRTEPYFKTDFGFDLLLGQNYVSHLGVYRLDAIKAVGGFRLGYEGSQDYDLVLRILAYTKGPVVHMPWMLYHWRLFPGAGTFSSTQIGKASDAARRALSEQLAAKGISAEVRPWVHAYHRVVRNDLAAWPKVSIVVPTRDHVGILRTCVEGVLQRTDYPDIELIIANNDSIEAETFQFFDVIKTDPRVKVIDFPGPFNYSAINNGAVRASTGEIVVLLNNDIEVIEDRWLKEMVKHAVRHEVGAVGAKLLYPDNTIQHGGVVLGLNGVAGHLHAGVPADSPGYFGWLKIARNVSASTAACLAMRRSVFDEVGGLNETDLKVAFNDVDLCLRITEKKYGIVWTPEATLYHWESKSRGNDLASHHLERFKSEIQYMRTRWGARLDTDPFFNPNLSLTTSHPVMGFPPRRDCPWQAFLKPSTAAA